MKKIFLITAAILMQNAAAKERTVTIKNTTDKKQFVSIYHYVPTTDYYYRLESSRPGKSSREIQQLGAGKTVTLTYEEPDVGHMETHYYIVSRPKKSFWDRPTEFIPQISNIKKSNLKSKEILKDNETIAIN